MWESPLGEVYGKDRVLGSRVPATHGTIELYPHHLVSQTGAEVLLSRIVEVSRGLRIRLPVVEGAGLCVLVGGHFAPFRT